MELINLKLMSINRNIRKAIDPLVKVLFGGIHLVYGYKIHCKINLLLHYFYTWWIFPNFKHAGKNLVVYHPIQLKGAEYITIGDHTTIGRRGVVTAWGNYGQQQLSPKITIGNNCDFGEYLHVSCTNSITIGNNVLTGRWVTIIDNSHGRSDFDDMQQPPAVRNVVSKGPVVIQDNVWIGDKVTVMPGITIGTGAIVGANSVVCQDIPPYAIAAGCPAKIIKKADHNINETT